MFRNDLLFNESFDGNDNERNILNRGMFNWIYISTFSVILTCQSLLILCFNYSESKFHITVEIRCFPDSFDVDHEDKKC